MAGGSGAVTIATPDGVPSRIGGPRRPPALPAAPAAARFIAGAGQRRSRRSAQLTQSSAHGSTARRAGGISAPQAAQ